MDDDDAASVEVEHVARIAAEIAYDFDGTCLLLANELATSAAPAALLDVISQLTLALDDDDDDDDDENEADGEANGASSRRQRLLSEDLAERFESEFLPQVVQLALGKSFERASVAAVNRFLQFVLVRTKQKLLTGDPCLLPSLIRIFDDQRPFYIYHGGVATSSSDGIEDADVENNDNERGEDVPQFTVATRTACISVWFLRNLQFWGEIGGFALFLSSLRSMTRDDDGTVDTVLSFEAIQCVLRTLYSVKDQLAPRFLAAYFLPFCDGVRFFVKTVAPGEFYALPRETLFETVQVLELVLAKVLHDRECERLAREVVTGAETDRDAADNSSDVNADEDADDRMRESVQLLQLEILMRQLRSSSLERRIHGLSEIVTLATRQFNEQVQEQSRPTAASLRRKLAYLVRWLHEYAVIDELFGQKPHAELIKRSLPLFQFASELECLDPRWLELVWNCYGGGGGGAQQAAQPHRHEAHRTVVHDLLLELIECLDEPLLRVLLHKLQGVAPPDAGHLTLLAAIAARGTPYANTDDATTAADGSGEPCTEERGLREVVLTHLWRVAIPTAESDSAADSILQQMEEIIRRNANDGGDGERRSGTDVQLVGGFLQACVDNISRGEQTLVSLKWFTRLALLVTELTWRVAPLKTGAHSSIVEVLVENLLVLTTGASEASSGGGSAATPRVSELKAHLLALRAAWIMETRFGDVSSAQSALSLAQLDAVWWLVIERASAADEAALGFEWIEFCMNTSVARADGVRAPLLSESLVEHLLIHQFGALPGDRVTLSALCCFHGLFRHMNLLRQGLAKCAPDGSDDNTYERASNDCVATGESLVGLEQLWRLAVQCTTADVAEECITLLASLYLEFVPELRGADLPLRKRLEFVETCMSFLVAAKTRVEQCRCAGGSADCDDDSNGVDDDAIVLQNTATVNRCIDLLRFFLDACDATADAPPLRRLSSTPDSDNDVSNRHGESLLRAGEPLTRRAFELENLEERLQHLDIYPSPMKELSMSSGGHGESGATAGSRRPSWSFRHHHALLDAIPDDGESDGSEEQNALHNFGAASTPRTCSQRSVSIDRSGSVFSAGELAMSSPHTALLPARPTITSPTLRVRPKLQWPQDASPQRGPDLSAEDLSQALQEAASRPSATSAASPPLDAADPESVTRAPTPSLSSSSSLSSKYSIASQLLANGDAYFDALLQLVDWPEATSQRAWELLCRLPTNNKLLRKMIHLRPASAMSDDVVWLDQLPTGNTHRLLYALRLVEALLLPIEEPRNSGDGGCGSGADSSTDSARRQWRERFVRLGGAQHLYEVLLQWDATHVASAYTTNLTATCLAALLRTLNYLLELHKRDGIDADAKQQQWINAANAFDARLHSSTLPAFVHSICLLQLGESAVRLTFASASSGRQDAGARAAISAQTDEAIQCGMQLFSAVVALQPSILLGAFRDLSHASDRIDERRPRLTEWVACLLLECPSSASRSTALASLIALTADAPMCESRSLFTERLVCELCELAVDARVARDCVQLFAFLDSLLRVSLPRLEASKRDAVVSWLSTSAVPQRLLTCLSDVVAADASATYVDEDVVCGYLQLLRSLVRAADVLRDSALRFRASGGDEAQHSADTAAPLWTVDLILTQLLFGASSTSTATDEMHPIDATVVLPTCTSDRSRELAHALLFSLVAASPETQTPASERWTSVAVRQILTHHSAFQASVLESLSARGRPWSFQPSELLQDTASGIANAGLVNPGCICYMNALVQQLFMAPSFRDGLLAVACDQSASQWADEIAQLQELFVSLAFTRFKALDPTPFALSHRDLDGNATDLRVQMDADEFFCLLLDRIDTCLTNSRSDSCSNSLNQQSQSHPFENARLEPASAASFLDECFGGVLVNQIITQQGHVSEREEKFFALSLEVSKKQHLRDSLALYVQGESLDGENAYFCERVQQKVAATKRICIKTLPQTLVCHLKRFEFDFDAMEKLKLNDALEFPHEIDMAPFTSEVLAAYDASASESKSKVVHDDESAVAAVALSSSMYDLVGVVVHSGTADMGHYYSFIKDRSQPQRWLEFNDEVVQEFDVEAIGDECFGGEELKLHWDGHARVSKLQMKRRSAYMLLYERRTATSSPQGGTPSSQQVTCAHATTPHPALAGLIAKVQHENARFQSVVDAFGTTYSTFLATLVRHTLALPMCASESHALRDCSGAVADLPPSCTNVRAAVLACQYLFGIATLQPPVSSDCVSLQSQRALLQRTLTWVAVADGDPETDRDEEQQRCVFSAWLLRHAVASLAQATASVARSWVFDAVFLNESNAELVDGCLEILLAAVVVLTRQLVSSDDIAASSECRAVILDFYRALLDLFYDREQSIELVDPTSGGAVTLSSSATVTALARVGALLERCVCVAFADSPAERAVTHEMFVHGLQFFDRLLFSLQAELDNSASSSAAFADALHPSRVLDASGIPRVRACTLELERRILAELGDTLYQAPPRSSAYSEQHRSRGCGVAVDVNLVLSQTALANVLRCGFERELAPVLVRIALRGMVSQRDKLLALLMSALEDIKSTHLEPMLHLIESLLDAEQDEVAARGLCGTDADAAPLHRHVFSPSKGVLEAAAYYRDHHALQSYAFELLQFCVTRARDSQLLQDLFASDSELREQAAWITEWLTHRVDPSGCIRASRRPDAKAMSDTESAHALLDTIAKAFSGCHGEQTSAALERGRNQSDDSGEVDSALTLDDIVAEVFTSPKAILTKQQQQGPEADGCDSEEEGEESHESVHRMATVRRERISGTAAHGAHMASRGLVMRDAMYHNRSEA